MTPFITDCYIGAMREQKHRGSFSDWKGPLPSIEHLTTPAPVSPLPLEPVLPTELPPNPIGWGSYGWKYDPEIPIAAIQGGASIIDTAETYGYGKVETELGKVLASSWRNIPGRLQVATKVGRHHMSKKATINAALRSRDRLGLLTIPIYQIHWPSPTVPIEETLEAFAELREGLVIDKIGVCNFCAVHLRRAIVAANKLGLKIEYLQVRVNNSDRDLDKYLLPFARTLGIKIIAHSPLNQTRKPTNPIGQLMNVIARGVHYAIPGTNNLDHLRDNLSINTK